MMEKRIRVLIADDQPRSRQGLRALLSACLEVEAICGASNGGEALRMINDHQPDVVLMDVRMPLMDGLEATQIIKARWPEIKVVVLTMYGTYQAEAIAAGADVFLIKGCPAADLLAAIVDH